MRLSWAFVNFCMCPSFPFGIEGRVWDVIVLISDHCFSIYLAICVYDSFPFGFEDGMWDLIV